MRTEKPTILALWDQGSFSQAILSSFGLKENFFIIFIIVTDVFLQKILLF